MLERVTRRSALRRGALALAVAGAPLELSGPAAAYQKTAAQSSHTIRELEQRNGGDLANDLHTHFDGGHTTPYTIDFDHKFMGSADGRLLNGWLVFREYDSENFYQLRLQASDIFFERKVAGALVKQTSASWPLEVNVLRRVRLTMNGNLFQVYDRERSLAVPVLTYIDPDNLFPEGRSFAYYTAPGIDACWENVDARPV